MVEVSVMKLLDRCIQQEIAKNGEGGGGAFVDLARFLEDLGQRVREVVYAIAIPGVLMLNIRHL